MNNKKQNINLIMICIIAILILIIGILCGYIFILQKNNNTSVNIASSSVAATEPTAEPLIEPEIEANDIDEIENARSAVINSLLNNNEMRNISYSLIDIDGDGIDELYVKFEQMTGYASKIYTYSDSTFHEACGDYVVATICTSEHYVMFHCQEGADVYRIFEVNGDQINKKDEIYRSAYMEYFRNGNAISESEYSAALVYYRDLQWLTPITENVY